MNQFIDRNAKWIFPLPSALFVIIMMAFPVIFTIAVSLTNWSMTTGGVVSFIGFHNYIELFKNPRFYNAFLLTFYFTVFAVVIELFLGVAVALILNREFAGKNFVKTILLLPYVSTPVAIGLAWTLFYEPTVGLANYTLRLLGLPVSNWLASNNTVIPSIALVDIWQFTPMVILIVMAGLAGLPQEPFESARVDGASPLQVLYRVTLPLLTPTILTAAILRSIDAFKTFDIIYTMTGGGPGYSSETLNIFAYKEGFGYFHFGSASSILLALFGVVLTSSLLQFRLRKAGSDRIC